VQGELQGFGVCDSFDEVEYEDFVLLVDNIHESVDEVQF
jgi:hypothetical protein